jgi:hypothetical protein
VLRLCFPRLGSWTSGPGAEASGRHLAQPPYLPLPFLPGCLAGCRWVDNEGDYDQLMVASERVDMVVKEDVLLMKVRHSVVWHCVVSRMLSKGGVAFSRGKGFSELPGRGSLSWC